MLNKLCVIKLSFYTNTKDKTPLLSQSSLVYKFICPGCSSCYVGKTEKTSFERTEEHEENKKEKWKKITQTRRKMIKVLFMNIYQLVHIITIYKTYLI